MIKCENCQTEFDAQLEKCPACGHVHELVAKEATESEVKSNPKACKNCGTLLDTRLKVCPVCHIDDPLNLADLVVEDQTDVYDPINPEYELIRQKDRKMATILAFCLTFLGIPFFYLGYHKGGIRQIVASLILLGSAFLAPLGSQVFMIVLLSSLGVLLIEHLIVGFYFLTNSEIKDARGEYLK